MRYVLRVLLLVVMGVGLFALYNSTIASKYGFRVFAAGYDVIFPEPPKPGPIEVKPGADPKTTVAITIDDGKISSKLLQAIIEKYRLHCTHFIVPLRVGEPEYMTWDDFRKILKYGCDVESHSLTHPNLTKLSPEQIRVELNDSRTLIQKILGVTSTIFATPEGEHDHNVRMEIRRAEYHAHVLGYGGEYGLVNEVSEGMMDPFKLVRWDVKSNHVALDICEAVRKAEERPQILIFVFHFGLKRPAEADAEKLGVRVYKSIGRMIPPEFHVFEDEFERMMECIAKERDEGRIRVTSIPRALAYYRAMQERSKTEADLDLERSRAEYPAALERGRAVKLEKSTSRPEEKRVAREQAPPKAMNDEQLKKLLTIMAPEGRRR